MLRAFSVLVMTTLVASLAWAAQTLSGPAPGFSLQSRDGQQVSLASLKGKVVMVNFWATWCVPCRQEMPHLQALYDRYNSLGFELLAVNVEKNNAEGARKWLEETPVTFPVLFDPNNEVTKLYKVQTMPSTVLVARDGTMRFIHHGYKPGYESDYQTQVRALLRE
jgi:peroxiredoxin